MAIRQALGCEKLQDPTLAVGKVQSQIPMELLDSQAPQMQLGTREKTVLGSPGLHGGQR